MREIKFRAWDKTNNEWYMGGDVFDLNFSGSFGDFFFDNDHPLNMREVKLIWCQFTDLKDKNGKEIYEGDIVKVLAEHDVQSDVFYDLGRWQPFSYLGDYGEENFEVIGNIYENPELLNEQKP